MGHQYPFKPIRIPYSMMALSPYLAPDTLYVHYQHYQGRVRELNRLVVQHRLTDLTLEEILTQKINLPVVQEERLKNAAGAVFNHELFFDGLKAEAGAPPLNHLVEVLIATYGSMARFRQLLLEAAQSLPGVGWVWLVGEQNGGLHLVVTRDNGTVQLDAVKPILVLDLWEHAYFLDNWFDLPRYVDTWFSLIDWDRANARFQSAV
ncbi:superoxide dismutase [uncultured Oscillibacter sp.]|uniref:superoxide dismutase n=1 Tax=uncultured Oscillibacter sp. TaxID=876091 RepID=UPI0025DC4390|nr:superoxide dismutase [uncultured Oscillibacter sp.]